MTLPLWLFILILIFAVAAFATHFLFPSVRWFLRRRMQRAVDRLNRRLERPIQPFKLLRRYDLIQRLCYDPEVASAIVAHARETGVREDVAFERARAYAREIVPSFSAFTYFGWGVGLARRLSNALFRVRLLHHDSAALQAIDPEATVVFVMNHRSNMDYVLVTHLVADRSALSYAVGEWAHVWPLSRLIRSMGAYFIRRRARDMLYRRVLRRYVQMSTEAGVTQAIFPEGGLSLDGRVSPPKKGLLSYIVEGGRQGARDIVFVPVALNYDRVLEDRVLIGAGQAGTRRFDAGILRVMRAVLRQAWRKLTGRFRRFGYAAVSFGTPLSLRDAPDLAADADALATTLMQRIAAIVPVLPVPLVAWLLMQAERQSREELERGTDAAVARLGDAQVHLPRGSSAAAVEVGLQALTGRGIAAEQGGQYAIVPEQRALAEYYANSVAHLMECDEDNAATARL
ncbi:1-acyl-sn-glycerol-3-phosphate acyltransferase [Citreimonas salinaria]|uniref:1-acyl-sn-glycerol-3-phosphate acyltransferase n=1 Tax=Citreimonas salinaria TaxID=321339 RepID=UPI003CCBD390